jgi:hypothetical protein
MNTHNMMYVYQAVNLLPAMNLMNVEILRINTRVTSNMDIHLHSMLDDGLI